MIILALRLFMHHYLYSVLVEFLAFYLLLMCGYPYHAYLKHCLFELRSQNKSSAQQPPSQPANFSAPESTPSALPVDNCETLMKPKPSSQFKPFHKIYKVQCTCSNHMAIFFFFSFFFKKTLDVKRFYFPIYFIYSLLPYILK
ncbi:unnamed protein product, partial [Vitis vinifera]|uniref:Uncharacterized protein n=1 Tax=Vitis vinifera TaxID=29760 RepID=D7UB82_VITVI